MATNAESEPDLTPETVGDLLTPHLSRDRCESALEQITLLEDAYVCEQEQIPPWLACNRIVLETLLSNWEREL